MEIPLSFDPPMTANGTVTLTHYHLPKKSNSFDLLPLGQFANYYYSALTNKSTNKKTIIEGVGICFCKKNVNVFFL